MLNKLYCNLAADLPNLKFFADSDQDYFLAPAFLDIQVNGYDTISLDKELTVHALECMNESMLRDGVSQFVPTVISSSYEHMLDTLENTRAFMQKHPNVIPGVHLEGPFISSTKCGIHSKENIRKMSAEDLKLILLFKDAIAYLTVDPLCLDQDCINILLQNGIKLSLGHTSCDYSTAMGFFEKGASMATHLFNAMSKSPNGRNPMAVEAVLANSKIYTGVIADGVHVSYPMVKIAWRLLGDHFILTTDALSAAGVQDVGSYVSFSFANKVIYNDPMHGCVDENGTLAGSRLTMLDGVKNLVDNCCLSVEDAIYAASVAPRKALQMQDNSTYIILDGSLNLVNTFHL